MAGSNNSNSGKDKRAPNMKRGNPAQPGHGGGQGDTPAKSNNPADWKNEPGNQS